MSKVSKKQKWQGFAKTSGIKFQGNDTINMLVISIAHKIGVKPDEFKTDYKLELAVETEFLKKFPIKTGAKKEKEATPTTQVKKEVEKKPIIKAKIGKETPKKGKGKTEVKTEIKAPFKLKGKIEKVKSATKVSITLPNFKNVAEMKHFCVGAKLSKIDGYKEASKAKKTIFLNWILDNISNFEAEPTNTPEVEEKSNPQAKSSIKKEVVVETPIGLSEEQDVKFPEFKNIEEMKHYCVSFGLNKVDGYILKTKGSDKELLQWMIDNKEFVSQNNPTDTTTNPHSPSVGIGELNMSSHISKAVEVIGSPKDNTSNGIPVDKIGKVEVTDASVNVNLAPIQTNDNPESIVDSQQNSFEPKVKKVMEELPYGKGNPQMEIEANSVIEHLVDSFQARFHGGMMTSDFIPFLNQSLGKYNPELKNEGNGYFFSLNDGNGNECNFPKDGYLPLR